MVVKISQRSNIAVDQGYYWQSLQSCPRGVNVRLLTQYGKAIDGIYKDGDTTVIGWTPNPKIPDFMKAMMK